MTELRFSNSVSDVFVNIEFTLDDEDYSVILDSIDDTNYTEKSTITSSPVVDGYAIADHMYRDPADITLSGSLIVSSKSGQSQATFTSSLSGIEEFFRRIKNEAIICKITKISSTNKQFRFMTHKNCVLESISFTEKINSLHYSFSFREVMFATIEVDEPSQDDRFLPDVSVLQPSSFVQSTINWNEVDGILNTALLNNDLMKVTFLQGLSGAKSGATFILGGTVAIGVGLAAIPGVNVVAAVGVGVALLGVGIYSLVSSIVENQKFTIKAFEDYEEDKDRYEEFVGTIHNTLKELDNNISVYELNSDNAQECVLLIDDQYYEFDFSKQNLSDNEFSLTIRNVDGTIEKVINNVLNSALVSLLDCSSLNCLYKTPNSEKYVYLMRQIQESAKLSDCAILVSDFDLSTYNDRLYELCLKAFTY